MDNQITGSAGEFFVAAELLKRNLQVSLTLGNAKSIDLIAINQVNKDLPPYQIQVKTLRKKPNCFDMHSSKINDAHIYIFVYLNAIDDQPDYYIVKGHDLLFDLKHYYGASLGRLDKRETINSRP